MIQHSNSLESVFHVVQIQFHYLPVHQSPISSGKSQCINQLINYYELYCSASLNNFPSSSYSYKRLLNLKFWKSKKYSEHTSWLAPCRGRDREPAANRAHSGCRSGNSRSSTRGGRRTGSRGRGTRAEGAGRSAQHQLRVGHSAPRCASRRDSGIDRHRMRKALLRV